MTLHLRTSKEYQMSKTNQGSLREYLGGVEDVEDVEDVEGVVGVLSVFAWDVLGKK